MVIRLLFVPGIVLQIKGFPYSFPGRFMGQFLRIRLDQIPGVREVFIEFRSVEVLYLGGIFPYGRWKVAVSSKMHLDFN